AARPVVIPAFVHGLGNDLPRQIRGNFDRSGEPITIVFGKPVELGDLFEAQGRLRTYKRVADRLRDTLLELGRRDRELRRARGWPCKAPAPAPARTDALHAAPP
ncbi:MAG TPA: hypothetical protein PLI95_26970, partial [Polyangiaceae bacterium]|nr:hypothetical protein [Polyangiaceae bacterium]